MSNYKGCRIPEELLYNIEYHVWTRLESQFAYVGATEPAQAYAGEVIFIKAKAVGTKIARGEILATVESAKFMGPMRSPLTGSIAEVNTAVVATPSLINKDSYANWLIKLQPENLEAEKKDLISGREAAEKYKPIIDEWGVDCGNT